MRDRGFKCRRRCYAEAIHAYSEVGDPTEPELRWMAPTGLQLAESVREFLEAAGVPPTHSFWHLYDELADHAETIADSIDEELKHADRKALDELSRGDLIPFGPSE